MTIAWFVFWFACAFLAMELVSYAAHRWLMHGPGAAWHASHHAPPTGRFEKNDRFPIAFSLLGVLLFVGASAGVDVLWPVGTGVAAYGMAYLAVHEIVIHRRVPCPIPRLRYLEWLRRAHADHHRSGGEPYGMLLPMRRSGASDSTAADGAVLDRRT